MTKFVTHMFGDVDLEEDGAYVAGTVDAQGRTTRPSLFVGDGLNEAQLKSGAGLIDNVSALEPKAREAILADLMLGDEGMTAAFVAFHLEELDADTVSAIFGPDEITPSEALERLQLVALGVHRAKAYVSLNLDFSFGTQHTDELLVVRFDSKGTITGVSHES